MKIEVGMVLQRRLKDPSGQLQIESRCKVSGVSPDGYSIRIEGAGINWYSPSSFNIVFSIGDTLRFKNTVAGRTYVVRSTDSYTKQVGLVGFNKWYPNDRLVMVKWKNTNKEGSMACDKWNTRDHRDDDSCRNIRRGDVVECLCDSFEEDDDVNEGEEYVVEASNPDGIKVEGCWYEHEDLDQFEVVKKREDREGTEWCPPKHKPVWSTKTGGSSMGLNTTIAGMYDSTVSAVLVNKYFGHEVAQNKSTEVLFADKADELLAKAKELQAKDDEQRHVVRAQIVE